MLCRKVNIIPKVDPSKIKIYSLSDKVNLQEDSNFYRKFRLDLFLYVRHVNFLSNPFL